MSSDELLELLEGLESDAYEATIGMSESAAETMAEAADTFFEAVLAHYGLRYFNPGEPVAIPEEDWDTPGCGPNAIPLTSCDAGNNGGMRTWEEDEAEREAGDTLLPSGLYWARLRLQQARDVLGEGWQYGLEEPEED